MPYSGEVAVLFFDFTFEMDLDNEECLEGYQ